MNFTKVTSKLKEQITIFLGKLIAIFRLTKGLKNIPYI